MSLPKLLARGLLGVARRFQNLKYGGNFFKSMIAASAIGAGEDAVKKNDFSRAYKILREVEDFEVDDVWVGGAQWQLGVLYFYGHGVDKSETKAIEMFEKAARAGYSDAIDYMRRRAAYLRTSSSNHSLQPTGFAGG